MTDDSDDRESRFEPAPPIDDEVTDALTRYERTIDHQLGLLNSIDDKAQTVVQYTGVVLGLLATSVSLIPRINGVQFSDVPESSKLMFIGGAMMLLGAIVGGMITYLSSVITYGLGPKFGASVAERRIQSPIYEESILNSYADAVDENRDVINTNAIRFKLTLEILIAGLSLLALSGLYAILSPPLWGEGILGVLWMLLTGAVLGYIHREAYLVLDRK